MFTLAIHHFILFFSVPLSLSAWKKTTLQHICGTKSLTFQLGHRECGRSEPSGHLSSWHPYEFITQHASSRPRQMRRNTPRNQTPEMIIIPFTILFSLEVRSLPYLTIWLRGACHRYQSVSVLRPGHEGVFCRSLITINILCSRFSSASRIWL